MPNPNNNGIVSGGVRRLIFLGNRPASIENRYVSGSGVGPLNASVRRALIRRANFTSTGKPCIGLCNRN